MRVLAIETSCDETAVAVLECTGDVSGAVFTVLGNALYSQAEKHAAYGGVYPNLAKREHQKNLPTLAHEALRQAGMSSGNPEDQKENLIIHDKNDKAENRIIYDNVDGNTVSESKTGEEEFKKSIAEFLDRNAKPEIDLIAVTHGPGLEPALWSGITFAETLAEAWDVQVIGVDHMEGHIVSALLKPRTAAEENTKHKAQSTNLKIPERYTLDATRFPLMALLISGGHTELILMKEWFSYEVVGRTRDDAVGEAFDKVARLLSLPYPGGPRIAELAAISREKEGKNPFTFPSPMTGGATCDFSFSGLKTSVLYTLKKIEGISDTQREHIAEAFENAAKDALVIQTRKALRANPAETLLIAGGVSANKTIRSAFTELLQKEFPNMKLALPDASLTGDNAIMIGAAGYLRREAKKTKKAKLAAAGKLRLET